MDIIQKIKLIPLFILMFSALIISPSCISNGESSNNEQNKDEIINRRNPTESILFGYKEYKNCKNANNEDIAFILRLINEKSRTKINNFDEFKEFKVDFFKNLKNGEIISDNYPVVASECTIVIAKTFTGDIYCFFKYEVNTQYHFFIIQFSNISIEFIDLINKYEFNKNQIMIGNLYD